MHVDDVEVGVVDGGVRGVQSHFGFGHVWKFFVMDGGLGDVEEGVHQRTLARVLGPENYQRLVHELPLRQRLA